MRLRDTEQALDAPRRGVSEVRPRRPIVGAENEVSHSGPQLFPPWGGQRLGMCIVGSVLANQYALHVLRNVSGDVVSLMILVMLEFTIAVGFGVRA